MSKQLIGCAAALLAALTFLGAQAPKAPASPTIHELFVEDQKDREAAKPDWNIVSAHDKRHRELAHQMLEAGTLHSAQDFEDASFIFQHGDTPQDYLLAHILAMAAMEKGDANARWIAAATLDRYLQSVKQPQVFGTQYRWDNEGPNPSKDATQQPYDKALLSDALRQEFCVTSYAGQQQNLDALNHNKDFPSPDHCPKQ
jgi:hypothetical protein